MAYPTAAVFDKDGVLVDSEPIKAETWARVLSPYSDKDMTQWYLGNIGQSDIFLASRAIEKCKIPITRKELVALWRCEYERVRMNASPIPGSVDVLKRIAIHHRVAVASSMSRSAILDDLERLQCREYVSAVVSGEDCEANKPSPHVYLAAASALGLEATNCVAVEDSPAGVEAAKGAGMYCVGLASPHYSVNLSAADVVVENLLEADTLRAMARSTAT